MMGSYYPLFLDTGIVVLSSCLLLWASGTFRQQLLKDFGIIRTNNVQTIRVNAREGPRNNNHWATNVSHQHTSSVQQMPTIS
ncbi:hypothetical protein GPALN_014510 [Globodera pallida]|nr:hypothetical protein GPALN_005981 [Globodera pallida]KAI3420888.1 hypothetical protein GPALN_014510 [Globodera pallida]